MLDITIVDVLRRSNNSIYAYNIEDSIGNKRIVSAHKLKDLVRSNKVNLLNYKLTSDNRLIRVKSDISIYYLMNKDKVVLEFSLGGSNKVFSKLPYDFKEIISWLDMRFKISCARDTREFFRSIGLDTIDNIINVTHCVSLHDTFWVKNKYSKLKWKNVSPFIHSYSEVISAYALEGVTLGINEKSYFSPVVGTDGSFPHTWKFNNGNIKFIKAGSKYTLGGINSGREPFSEYYASVVAEYLGFNHIPYRIRVHKRQDLKLDTVTECDCYTTEELGSVTAYSLGLNSYEQVIDYCKKLNDNAYSTILDMLFLDCLLLNTDRHFSNIEFFINNDTLQIVDIVPIFDNNYSFLPRFIEGYETFDRSEYIARDGRTFEELYSLVLRYKSYKKKLIRLKDLRLEKPKTVDISDSRLKFLNMFLQLQVDYLLHF